MLNQYSLEITALIFSLIAGLSTGLGALPVLFKSNFSLKSQDTFMGFGSGIMLAATFFSLITPGLEVASQSYGSGTSGAVIICLAIFMGAGTVHFVHENMPHEHFLQAEQQENSKRLSKTFLIVAAITLHNFPEGLAVGVGFGSHDLSNAISIAVAISLQNIPEGLVVALALVSQNFSKARAIKISFMTGLVEPVGALIGFIAISFLGGLLPWSLGFAAGAMLFVVCHEMIPESHRQGFQSSATTGLLIGFSVMIILDQSFTF
jgi:zinc transporter, ZIP family